MRVLYFHQHFTTPSAIGGTRSYEFARALLSRGHTVTMVCGQHESSRLDLPWDAHRKWYRGEVDGIDVIALPLPYSNRDNLLRRSILFLRYALRSATLTRHESYDLLFATSTPLTAGVPGITMRLSGGSKPFVFEVRDLWPELPRALGVRNPLLLGGMSILEWLSYRCASGCIGLAPGIVGGIRKRAGIAKPIALIPNGCDLDLFTPEHRTQLALPGVRPGAFVAGFTGAHGIANGLDAVLNAAAVLKARGRHDVQLLLIGEGGQKSRLVERAAGEGLDNVIFLPPMRKSELSRVTASLGCGLMVLANVPAFYFGTSPNKFFDYISAGIPVVCNYPGWLSELITDHDFGTTVRPDDAEAFADALCRLADAGPEARARLGARARSLAIAQFGRAQLASRFVDFLEHIAATPQHRPERWSVQGQPERI